MVGNLNVEWVICLHPCIKLAYKIILYAAEKKHSNLTIIILYIEIDTIFTTIIISQIILIVAGPPKFIVISKNQKILIDGIKANKPLFKTILRECDRIYIKLTPKNIPDDVNPWQIIIQVKPQTPIDNPNKDK